MFLGRVIFRTFVRFDLGTKMNHRLSLTHRLQDQSHRDTKPSPNHARWHPRPSHTSESSFWRWPRTSPCRSYTCARFLVPEGHRDLGPSIENRLRATPSKWWGQGSTAPSICQGKCYRYCWYWGERLLSWMQPVKTKELLSNKLDEKIKKILTEIVLAVAAAKTKWV